MVQEVEAWSLSFSGEPVICRSDGTCSAPGIRRTLPDGKTVWHLFSGVDVTVDWTFGDRVRAAPSRERRAAVLAESDPSEARDYLAGLLPDEYLVDLGPRTSSQWRLFDAPEGVDPVEHLYAQMTGDERRSR